MTRKQVMDLAWAIKNADRTNLFSECLKLAWKVSRETGLVSQLGLLGFNRWEKTTDSGRHMDRMYIDAESLGLWCDHYKTGRICDATLDGEYLSHSRAYDYKHAKTYFDLDDGRIHMTKGYAGEELGHRAKALLEAVTGRAVLYSL